MFLDTLKTNKDKHLYYFKNLKQFLQYTSREKMDNRINNVMKLKMLFTKTLQKNTT